MYIADLHIHSRFSRATSREGDTPHLDLAARQKGIHLVGTGDFTHPQWRRELAETLEPAETGLYTLKPDLRLPDTTLGAPVPRFIITGEISTIYKKDGRTRKVHSLILLPDLDAAERLARRLETIGNIHSDGRPILGLDCRDLLAITLDVCPEAVYVPAHIWTPHFSVFGAFSGFDSLEACFGDLTPHIHALETGLSSDPPMNWRLSALDGYQLISSSDAHSPSKLGREATLFDGDLSYPMVKHALETGEGLKGTLEFFPEEGKYHYDGHRSCHLCLSPAEARRYDDRCPVCGKKLTIGVDHRVEALADRPEGYRPADPAYFESLVPLAETIAAAQGWAVTNPRTEKTCRRLRATLGPEFAILRDIPLDSLKKEGGTLLAEGIRRLRKGQVRRTPGYDGVYGTIRLFEPSERSALEGQISLLATLAPGPASPKPAPVSHPLPRTAGPQQPEAAPADRLNAEQQAAVTTPGRALAVIAGPGTGKTKTLVARILYLLTTRNVPPSAITAITFTRKAADEMAERLATALHKKQLPRSLTVGTFHAVCYRFLKDAGYTARLADPETCLRLAETVLQEAEGAMTPTALLKAVSLSKTQPDSTDDLPAVRAYQDALKARHLLDFDDLILETLACLKTETRKALRKKHFDFLLVDEFQDINPLQYALIRALNQDGTELFVIGDPDQSIYGFRGSDPGCFDRLQADYPALTTIRLHQNYRSTPAILDAAQAVIARNPGPARHIQATLPPGQQLTAVSAAGPQSEGIYIARTISRLMGGLDMLEAQGPDGHPALAFSDFAVLYRTHHQADALAACLQKEGIPCVICGREDFLADPDVQGTLAFFRHLLDPDATEALRTALRYLWHIPEDILPCLIASLDTVDRSQCSFPYLKEKYQGRHRTAPVKVMQAFLKDLGLDTPACQRLLELAASYKTLAALFDCLTFGEDGDLVRSPTRQYRADAVRLMTFHAAKGLEFPVVFLAGLKEGVVPLTFGSTTRHPEEERRLFYVGMTRARTALYLTYFGKPSPFLADIPPALVTRDRAGAPDTGRQLNLFGLFKKQ